MSSTTAPRPRRHRALALIAAMVPIAELIYGAVLATAAMLGQRIAVGILAVMRALIGARG